MFDSYLKIQNTAAAVKTLLGHDIMLNLKVIILCHACGKNFC